MAKSTKPPVARAPKPAPGKPADPRLFLVQVPADPKSKRKFTYKIVTEVGEIPDPAAMDDAEAKLFLNLLDGYFSSPAMRPLLMLAGKFPAGFSAFRDLATRFATTVDGDD